MRPIEKAKSLPLEARTDHAGPREVIEVWGTPSTTRNFLIPPVSNEMKLDSDKANLWRQVFEPRAEFVLGPFDINLDRGRLNPDKFLTEGDRVHCNRGGLSFL